MLSGIIIFLQRFQQCLNMFFIAQEVGMACVHEQGFHIVLLYVLRIGFLQFEQIFVRYILLIGTVTLPDIFLQFHGRVINQQIGLHSRVDDIKQFLVKSELLVGQIDPGEQTLIE